MTGSKKSSMELVSNLENMAGLGLELKKSGFKIPMNLQVNINKQFSTVLHYDIKF